MNSPEDTGGDRARRDHAKLDGDLPATRHRSVHLPGRRPRVLSLFVDTSFLRRTTRVSHVHRCTVTACRALRPRRCRTSLPLSPSAIVSSGLFKPSTLPKFVLNGAQSLQPEGLRPTASLSTLNCAVTGRQPKTRYRMRRVTASRAGLPPASTTAPRGAQIK